MCPITQWQTGFPEGTPIYEGEETCSLRGHRTRLWEVEFNTMQRLALPLGFSRGQGQRQTDG